MTSPLRRTPRIASAFSAPTATPTTRGIRRRAETSTVTILRELGGGQSALQREQVTADIADGAGAPDLSDAAPCQVARAQQRRDRWHQRPDPHYSDVGVRRRGERLANAALTKQGGGHPLVVDNERRVEVAAAAAEQPGKPAGQLDDLDVAPHLRLTAVRHCAHPGAPADREDVTLAERRVQGARGQLADACKHAVAAAVRVEDERVAQAELAHQVTLQILGERQRATDPDLNDAGREPR